MNNLSERIRVFSDKNKANGITATGGWYLGIDVCITAEKINNKWVYYCNTELLETYENSILYYLPRELGTRVVYWDENKSGVAHMGWYFEIWKSNVQCERTRERRFIKWLDYI